MKIDATTTPDPTGGPADGPTGVTSYDRMPSPIGTLLLVSRDGALTGLYVDGERLAAIVQPDWRNDPAPLAAARRQLEEYFAGERTTFSLDVRPAGTPFQQEVWAALLEIEYGQTASYGDIARRLGKPNASRAVGAANGRNPVSIVIPCHRVIAANGTLGGYGWGLPRKTWLLDLERGAGQLFMRS